VVNVWIGGITFAQRDIRVACAMAITTESAAISVTIRACHRKTKTREAMESAMTWAVSVCTTPTTARIRGTLENVEVTVLDNVAQRADPAAEAENAIFKHTRQHM